MFLNLELKSLLDHGSSPERQAGVQGPMSRWGRARNGPRTAFLRDDLEEPHLSGFDGYHHKEDWKEASGGRDRLRSRTAHTVVPNIVWSKSLSSSSSSLREKAWLLESGQVGPSVSGAPSGSGELLALGGPDLVRGPSCSPSAI